MKKCPGEDSNLHEPKLTSPSSYEGSEANGGENKDLACALPGSGDQIGAELSPDGKTAPQNPSDQVDSEIEILIEMLVTFSSQERSHIISGLSKQQRLSITKMLVSRFAHKNPDPAKNTPNED